MEVMTCKTVADGLNYIVWKESESPKGIFVIHAGGPSRFKLYRLWHKTIREEFKGKDIYFCTQKDSYWRNNTIVDGRYADGTEVLKYIGKRC